MHDINIQVLNCSDADYDEPLWKTTYTSASRNNTPTDTTITNEYLSLLKLELSTYPTEHQGTQGFVWSHFSPQSVHGPPEEVRQKDWRDFSI